MKPLPQGCAWPDYARCGVNVTSSILHDFGLSHANATLPELDARLSHGYRNIVLMLLDGMGMEILRRHSPGGFLDSHVVTELSAVFPSTTAAAATSLRNGLYPGQHGWLGWTMFFPQTGQSVDVYPNTLQFTREPAGETHLARTYLPFESAMAGVTTSGTGRGWAVSAHDEVFAATMPEVCAAIRSICEKPGRNYVYAYSGEPDASCHKFGTKSREARDALLTIEHEVEALARTLRGDTLLVVTADHGLIDSLPVCLEDFPALREMLIRPPVLEPRAAALFVNDWAKPRFAQAFQGAAGDGFLLVTQRETLDMGLFGPGALKSDLRDYIGDFIAISVSDKSLFDKHEHVHLIGMHAGVTKSEMRVPLILIDG